MSDPPALAWDVFCNVVDNLGDIGVCWRLARQLAVEQDAAVRLWVNDLESFARIALDIDPRRKRQSVHGVDVHRWQGMLPGVVPAMVVLETFGCALPDDYLQAMAARDTAPVWINLEYLSAEAWVGGCHGLPSPHPRLPLTKYYFFPGFTSATGGLLREHDLLARHKSFASDPLSRHAFWRSLEMRQPVLGETTVSMFCYENPAIPDLLQSWAAGPRPVRCLVPDTRVAAAFIAFFAPDEKIAPAGYRRRNLEVQIFPLLSQERYDQLLWACDCNFVRGEDSFVRAQWAAMPLVWHIYPQKENAHWVKLNAFIDLYTASLAADVASDVRAFWRSWVSGRGAGAAWRDFWRQRDVLEAHAMSWRDRLAHQADLATNLVQFAHRLLK